MNDCHYDFVKECSKQLDLKGPIVEIGSRQVAGQERWDLRQLFPGYDYIGVDMQDGPGVDVVDDVTSYRWTQQEMAGTIICCAALEHIDDLQAAMKTMKSMLRPNNHIIITVPFSFHIHAYPDDYWRFTPSGLGYLMKPFGHTTIAPAGPKEWPHTVAGVAGLAYNNCHLEFDPKPWMKRWRYKWKMKLAHRWAMLRRRKTNE